MGRYAFHEFPIRTEDSGIRMMKRMIAFAMITLMLAAFSDAAGAEGMVPATPTDLSCLHEHTRTTIYFFDSPVYTPIGAETHRVTGPAAVDTVCEDCGEAPGGKRVLRFCTSWATTKEDVAELKGLIGQMHGKAP